MNFNVLFPDVRESGETPIRQCQLVMTRMLKIFDFLCKKYEIEYFLTGGTLLGAIRHSGFVPWDDDLDVGMTRVNYEKFVQYAVPELPYDIFFQTPQTDPYYPSCGRVEAKLRDKYSSYKLSEDQHYKKFHLGLQVDIFIYDKAYFPHNALIYGLNRILAFFFWKEGANNNGNTRRAAVLKWISKYSPFPHVYSTSFIASKKMIQLSGDYIKEHEISRLVKAKFEGIDVYIPQGWEACLKRQFGDYLKLPPVEKRKCSHGSNLPDPFTPCNHVSILKWEKTEHMFQSVVSGLC